jgi:hypothetical protein
MKRLLNNGKRLCDNAFWLLSLDYLLNEEIVMARPKKTFPTIEKAQQRLSALLSIDSNLDLGVMTLRCL